MRGKEKKKKKKKGNDDENFRKTEVDYSSFSNFKFLMSNRRFDFL